MEIISFLLHILTDWLLGRAAITYLTKREVASTESLGLSILAGFVIETTLGFWLLWLGIPLTIYAWGIVLVAIGINIPSLRSLALKTSLQTFLKTLKSLKWYDWILIVLILEKLAYVSWQLFRMPTYHSDAIKHWSAAARAIYSGINWDLIANTPNFLGRKMGFVPEYPLGIPIWRAIGGVYNFGWSDFIARCDGLLFLILIALLIYSAFKFFTEKRWMALGSAFVIVSLPLQVWQGASGYVDNGVSICVAATLWCFIRKNWLLSGLFAAGAIWCKNDGLAIFLPGFLAASFIYIVFLRDFNWSEKIQMLFKIGAGVAIAIPWLLFQALYSRSIFTRIIDPIKGLLSQVPLPAYEVILVQSGRKFQNHPSSISLFWDYVFMGSTHGIFWIMSLVGLLLLLKNMVMDHVGRCLLLYLVVTSIIIYYVFTFTPAYEFLYIQTTIHRTMLQVAPVMLIILGYGVSLLNKKEVNL